VSLTALRRHEVVHAATAVMLGRADRISGIGLVREGQGWCAQIMHDITNLVQAQMILVAPWVDDPRSTKSLDDWRRATACGVHTLDRAFLNVRTTLCDPVFGEVARVLTDAMHQHDDHLYGRALEEVLAPWK
jgi:hypothetical protein